MTLGGRKEQVQGLPAALRPSRPGAWTSGRSGEPPREEGWMADPLPAPLWGTLSPSTGSALSAGSLSAICSSRVPQCLRMAVPLSLPGAPGRRRPHSSGWQVEKPATGTGARELGRFCVGKTGNETPNEKGDNNYEQRRGWEGFLII